MVVGTNPPARTTPIRLLVEAKASTAFLRRARVCSQPCQKGRAGQRASRQAAGQSRAQKEEVTSVLASHRYPAAPTGRGPLHGTASPSGSPSAQSQDIWKGGHGTQLGRRGSGKNGGEEKGPYQASSFLWLEGPLAVWELWQKNPGMPMGIQIQPLLP